MLLNNLLRALKPKKRISRNSGTKTRQRNLFDADRLGANTYKTKRKSLIPKKILYALEGLGRRKKLYISLSGIGIILSIGLFFIFGPVLHLQNIYINRSDTIININQAYSSIEYMRGKNILFLDTAIAASRLQSNQNTIRNIDFSTSFPDTLTIEISAYTPIFQTPGYLILENGAITIQEDENNTQLASIILSEDIGELEIFGKKLNASELKKIQTIISEAQKNILNFFPEKIMYFINEKEVLISTNLETIFIFDLTTDIGGQIEKLSIYQKEGGNITEMKYIYVDMRIPQKIFICPYESEFSCRTNLRNIYDDEIFTKLRSDVSQPEQ